MNKDLRDYVKVYENWFDLELCSQAIKEIENGNWTQHSFYNYADNESSNRSGSKELDVLSGSDEFLTFPIIMQKIWKAVEQYILKDMDVPWFQNWNGFTPVRFNRYKETQIMAEHCDHIRSMFDGQRKGIPVLSIVGSLNNDYKGGEFIMFRDEIISIPAGSLLIFPSVFLYPHKVMPVTKGTRYTFVSWVW